MNCPTLRSQILGIFLLAFELNGTLVSADSEISCKVANDVWLDLIVSITENNTPEFICKLSQLSDINGFPAWDSWENRLLNYAAKYDRVDMIDLLLSRGADPEIANAAGKKPIHTAISAGAAGAAATLLRHVRDVEQPDYEGRTLLFWALSNENADMIQLLLSMGADINARFGTAENSLSILEYAAQNHIETLLRPIKAPKVEISGDEKAHR